MAKPPAPGAGALLEAPPAARELGERFRAAGHELYLVGGIVRDLLINDWERLYQEPFRGITTDGHVKEGLYALAPNGAPTQGMIAATLHLLQHVSADERRALLFPVDAREWRRCCQACGCLGSIGPFREANPKPAGFPQTSDDSVEESGPDEADGRQFLRHDDGAVHRP